ncbi:hypothetical protein A6A25_29770 [Saccharothrix sp. CB00851]|nr:hypothetical protein A6A25_29770 [Saccharothrix sp. CB00851]
MTPVLERWCDDCPFWTVEAEESHLAIARSPAPNRVAAAAWALVAHGAGNVDLRADVPDAAGAVEAFLSADADENVARHSPGGLRVVSGGCMIQPGCCLGLEEWRTWLRVLDGEEIWLGHSPDAVMEQRGAVVRIWADDDLVERCRTGPYVDLPRAALPDLLQEVRRDLLGFLDALGSWARATVPTHADRLVAAVDRRLVISPPLGL